MREAFQPLFLCAAKICRGGRLCAAVRGAGALRMRHTPCGCCPPDRAGGAGYVSAPFSLRGKEKAAGGKKKTAKGEFRFSPFAIPCKTTKKRADAPFLDYSRGFGLCKAYFKPSTNAMQMRIWIVRRGSRNTLRLFRISYVKYSTGVYGATRIFYRAMWKPNSTVARRAFGLRKV